MSNIEDVLKNANASHKWLTDPNGMHVRGFLMAWRESIVSALLRETKKHKIHRLQGNIEVIDRFLNLRDEVRKYQDGVRTGTLNRIK